MPHGPRNPAAAKREIGVSAEQGGRKSPRTDRNIIPDGSGHCDCISRGAETTCADGLPCKGRVQKVEFERLVREEIDSCGFGWGIQETFDKLGITLSSDCRESDCGKDEKP